MSDDDSFNYKPLRVFKKDDEERGKKRKRMPKGGSHKGKKSRSVDDNVKEEVKEGIVEMFAGTKRRQSLMDETPKACPVCRLPMHLLSGESMPTPRIHIENCKAEISDEESNPLPRDFCPDIEDCRSMERVHLYRFNHSMEDWLKNQSGEADPGPEQQEDCLKADLRSEDVDMLASEENGETVEGGGEKAGMSSSEEEEGKDETSLPSSPSDERRSKASLPASKERREVAADKEVEQSMQLGASTCEQSNLIGFQGGESGVGLESVEFGEHPGEAGGDQEEFSQHVQGLIQGLEEMSQQPFVVSSEAEDNEVNFRLSNEVAQQLEKIEEEHRGGLLNPDISDQSVLHGEGLDSDQILHPVLPKLSEQERDLKKKIMLEKLVDDITKSKVKENATLEQQDALNKDKDNNNKVSLRLDVKLNGRESKEYSIWLNPQKRVGKAMEVVASRLGMEVANLRFLVEKENGQWSRLVGKEKAKDLEGKTMAVRDSQ